MKNILVIPFYQNEQYIDNFVKYFYDVKTGLRVATENESGEGTEKRKAMTYYADYVDVKGIKFPYKMTMDVGMPLEFITQDC
jgi:hypothetical protein